MCVYKNFIKRCILLKLNIEFKDKGEKHFQASS